AFVAALLARRIRFRPHVTALARPAGRVVFFRHPCWRCGGESLLCYVEGWAVRARTGCGVALTRRPPRRRSTAAELAEALAPAPRQRPTPDQPTSKPRTWPRGSGPPPWPWPWVSRPRR